MSWGSTSRWNVLSGDKLVELRAVVEPIGGRGGGISPSIGPCAIGVRKHEWRRPDHVWVKVNRRIFALVGKSRGAMCKEASWGRGPARDVASSRCFSMWGAIGYQRRIPTASLLSERKSGPGSRKRSFFFVFARQMLGLDVMHKLPWMLGIQMRYVLNHGKSGA